MLIGIILAFIYIAILKAIEEPYISIIETSGGNVYSSIPARKKLHKIRNVSFGLYVLLLVVIYLLYDVLSSSSLDEVQHHIQGMTGAITGTIIVLSRNRKYSHYGKVSFSTIEDVRACKKPYILYLRAFEEDDYSYSKKNRKTFSEDRFISCFPNKVQTFTIGMTKEIFCPKGAKRVYCSDKTWQKDVKEMIRGAFAVVVLVSNRESCVWEINNLHGISGKIFFITDDVQEYNKARSNTFLPLLRIKSLEPKSALFIEKNTYSYKFTPFKFTDYYYKEIARHILDVCNQ